MFVISNTLKIKKGFEDQFLARFEMLGKIEESPGFLMLNVLKTRMEEEYDEFTIWTKWQSREAHDEWSKSESFRKSHGGGRSEYILDFKLGFYDVVLEKLSATKVVKDVS
ncbi:hypothetical protein BEP19_11865 [Ammoniphilus oxalaticus]|uniref:ABM domain-containing protein n=1 Tax=Ammoniphilus oxalaticus TaxID=66863 RepID=A0A419SGJ9_9BACL|nr:antibiotic biosynthesis monooxygenase [Ammoniphilus oxalaticus]RKD22922.1 hypothetical protein BEP19_11865 [Ammoniphilus oxalaticus]